MSDFNKIVGNGIKKVRKARGLTQSELADKYNDVCGEVITANMISMWENGKRNIYAEQLYNICRVLGCTPTFINPKPYGFRKDMFLGEVMHLNDELYDILLYAFWVWQGDVTALIKFMGLYMSIPQTYRREISWNGLIIYKVAESNGAVDKTAPKVDLDYIEKACELLEKFD